MNLPTPFAEKSLTLVAAVLVLNAGSLAAGEPPWIAFACAMIGGFAGLIVAGLLTPRPPAVPWSHGACQRTTLG